MSERGSLPGQPSQVPGLPSNYQPIEFAQFETLNTKPSRASIADGEMSWCDGWMPVAPNTLRTLWGTGPDVFTAQNGSHIVWFDYGNIGDTLWGFVLHADGSLYAYNVATPATIHVVLPVSTIANPRSIFGFSQWGSQYVVFTADQQNGYWLWDGTNTFGPGTIGPFVSLTNSGMNYTSPPTITLYTTGSGSGTTFSAQIDHESVSLITVTDPGSGFGLNDFAILGFSGGGSDAQALATANLSAGGGLTSIVVTDPGRGYTFNATLAISGGGGSDATGILNIQNGQIVSVTVLNVGHGYTSAPSLVVTDPGYGSGAQHIAGGTGVVEYAVVGANGIDTISMDSAGSGYTSIPTVEIVGDGTGAQAVAHVSGAVVTDIAVTNPGQGYTAALVKISGGNNAANADVELMPFGISGTTAEVYQQHVWVANGAAVAAFPPKNRVIFSAPESPADFGLGGGAFLATDSFVRVGYHSLKQSNGFLYLVGDSSLNTISGVTTSAAAATAATPAGPPITTFQNQNVDPQLGSPWPSSVQVFSRNINFGNTVGIFVSYGGAVTKVSEPLDGFYNSGSIAGLTSNYPAAVADIFGRPVYMLLLPVVDTLVGNMVNKFLMWDGKRWFTSQQDRNVIYIATQEINTVLSAWGTDGTKIFQLFARPSTGFTKNVQSKLYSAPAVWTTKTALRLTVVLKTIISDNQPLVVFIDNEVTQQVAPGGPASVTVQPVNNENIDVLGPYPVAQAGRMIGVTISTDASDLELLTVSVAAQTFETNI